MKLGMKGEYKRGLWTDEEDRILMDFIRLHGKGKWNRVAKMTGLKRCGKSCRLRWVNYLSPGVKRGDFSEEEDDLIIRLHNLLGNRWSLIAGRVPGRTDNQVKNHWNTHLSKKLGVKKGKYSKAKASPTSRGGEVEGNQNNPSLPQVSGSKQPTDEHADKDGPRATDHPSATLDESRDQATSWSNVSTEEVPIGGAQYQVASFSLPFVYDEDMNFCAPDLMEYVDECTLDLVWHGL